MRRGGDYDRVFVAYADCGTGGLLDRMLERDFEGVERIPGAHCYEFYAGAAAFEALQEEEVGTFYLTDFLARNFERIVWRGLGLDEHPELLEMYFANYRRLVYLAQTEDPELRRAGPGGGGQARSGLRDAAPDRPGRPRRRDPRGGRLMAGTLTVIWWRDIPAQVIAKDKRRASKIVLHPRFQVAIDRAALKAGRREMERTSPSGARSSDAAATTSRRGRA